MRLSVEKKRERERERERRKEGGGRREWRGRKKSATTSRTSWKNGYNDVLISNGGGRAKDDQTWLLCLQRQTKTERRRNKNVSVLKRDRRGKKNKGNLQRRPYIRTENEARC